MLRVRPVSHPHRSSKLAEQGLLEKQNKYQEDSSNCYRI